LAQRSNNLVLAQNGTSAHGYCNQLFYIEKEPFAWKESWQIKKGETPIGKVEKDTRSINETWNIKDLTGKTVGRVEKGSPSFTNEYELKKLLREKDW